MVEKLETRRQSSATTVSLLVEEFFACCWRDSYLPSGEASMLLILVLGCHVNNCTIKVVL